VRLLAILLGHCLEGAEAIPRLLKANRLTERRLRRLFYGEQILAVAF